MYSKTKLGDLVKITKGKKHLESTFSASSRRYIQIEDLSNSKNEKFTDEKGIDVLSSDVIIAWDGANAGKVGSNLEGVIGSTLARLRIMENHLDHNFLFRFLDSKFELIKSQRTGATIPHVSGEALKNLQIPLPPLPTQKHIAAILDKADALRQQNRQLLAHYDALLQSTFIEMFGDPVENPKGWEVKECREIISKIVAGNSFGGEDREMREGEMGVLKISAVTSGYFRKDEYKAVPKSLLGDNIILPKRGDLLFSRANTRELVAATCIVDNDYENIFLPDKLWKISLQEKLCNQYYFKMLLSQKELRQNLTKTATGTSGSMLNISMEKLRLFAVPVPPIDIQQKFAGIFKQIESQKQQAQASLAESEALFQGLLVGYFGEN